MVETSKKYFNRLDNQEKDKLRREYRSTHFKEYRHSIKLFIIQVILGIFCLIGLILLNFNVMLGMLVFVINFIFLLIENYFLGLSNYAFYKFLNYKRSHSK